jgi:hypothetical protein
MRFSYPLADAVARLRGDVDFYRRRYRSDIVTGPLTDEQAQEIIQTILEILFNQAMQWAVEPPGGRCDADDVIRKAYPAFYPDADNGKSARHFYYKALAPFYEYLQSIVDSIVGGHHTWDVLHVQFRQIKLRTPVQVEAFGDALHDIVRSELIGNEFAQAVESAGGRTAVASRGMTGTDYIERPGPWIMEVDNEGDYRVLDWTRRHARGEIELDGADPMEHEWVEANEAVVEEVRRSPLTKVTARTFGK